MKFRTAVMIGMSWFLLASAALAAPGKDKEPAGQIVDAGSLGIFMNGRRVATEKFSILQNAAGSIAKSEFKTEPGVDPAEQSSELQLTPSGDLLKYEWKETSPGKAQAVLVPNDSLLVERSTNNPQDKEEEHPFLLPVSTSVLDDYFFIHREILVWKYLATGCRQDKGQVSCPQNQQVKFGAINPHQRSSLLVSMAFTGKEKIQVHGVERDLNHFLLRSEAGDWSLWLDDQFKLVRILVAGDNTEVVRD
ncbi:MAG: hypothetical protein ACRD23_15305 [Terriglobales bacterium]